MSEQIESVLAQHDVTIYLLICDDCSHDATQSLCNRYAQKYDHIALVVNPHTLGVAQNFMQMIYDDGLAPCSWPASFDYYAFCDQDDIWLPDKLSHAIAVLQNQPYADEPCLYYSDATNFDDTHEWSEVAAWRPCENHPPTALIANWAQGCTMVFNHQLFLLLRSFRPPSFPRIHDSWVHLVARYCANVVPDLNVSKIRRRITKKNVVGAKVDHPATIWAALKDAVTLISNPDHQMSAAARLLDEGYVGHIHPSLQSSLDEFLHYQDTFGNRLRCIKRFDFYRPTWQGRAATRFFFLFGLF